ncbi:MAG: tetratricopeptide repeat protein, partial [Verrucomicrobiota bacterium]
VHFQLKAYDDAAKALADYTKKYKDHDSYGRGYVLLGRSHLEKKNYAEAAKTLKQAAEVKHVFTEASLWLGRSLMELKNLDEAEAVFNKAAESGEDKNILPSVLFDLANLLLTREKFEAAAGPYLKVIDDFSDHPQLADAMRQRAFCLHRAGKYADGIQQCDQFLTQFPQNDLSHEVAYIKAESFYQNEKPDEAIKAFDAVIANYAQSPRVKTAHLRRGQIYYEQEKWNDALTALNPLLNGKEEDPVFNQVKYMAGASAFKTEKWDDAVNYLNQFVQEQGKEANADLALFTAGMAHQRKKDHANAIQTLGRLSTAYPESAYIAQALTEKGRLEYVEKHYDPARKTLQSVVSGHAESPQLPTALYYLGWVDHAASRSAEAAVNFGRLADNHAEHELAAGARLQRGLIQLNLKKFAEAETALDKFTRTWPKDQNLDQATFHLGLALARQEKWQPALDRLKQLPTASKWHPQGLYESAWCAKNLDQADTAATLYGELLSAYPQNELALTAAFELAELEYQAGKLPAAATRRETLLKTAKDRSLRDRALYRLGWCYFDQGSALKAAVPFEQLIAESPDSELLLRA